MTLFPAVLDTTFVLPLFGIHVDVSPTFIYELKEMWKKGFSGFKLYLPSVCLLEILYKLNREFRKRNDPTILERYPLVLPSVLTSEIITLDNPYLNQSTVKVAFQLRQAGQLDLMDCLIAASAVTKNGLLITEDKILRKKMLEISSTKGVPTYSWNEFIDFLDKKILDSES